MDYFTEYKLSKYKEIEPLSDKGTFCKKGSKWKNL